MTILILKSLALLLGSFLVSAWLGWIIAPRARRKDTAFDRVPPAALFDEPPALAAVAVPASEPGLFEAPEEDGAHHQAAAPEATQEVADLPPPQPVSYLDAAAEAFTTGVVVPFDGHKPSPEAGKAPYAPPHPAPRLDMVAAAAGTVTNVMIRREDSSLQRRVSSLAAMTPESIAAAVQQAGTGLEPVRLGVPQSPPDDLTVISGIDSAKQRELNSLGVFYYWQIAGWSPENLAWISGRILSPDRAARENWMAQAARLARMN